MLKKGLHKASFIVTTDAGVAVTVNEGMINLISNTEIYVYSNNTTLDGYRYSAFKVNPLGFKYRYYICSTDRFKSVKYIGKEYIGEL